jgi:hypothetical protein
MQTCIYHYLLVHRVSHKKERWGCTYEGKEIGVLHIQNIFYLYIIKKKCSGVVHMKVKKVRLHIQNIFLVIYNIYII